MAAACSAAAGASLAALRITRQLGEDAQGAREACAELRSVNDQWHKGFGRKVMAKRHQCRGAWVRALQKRDEQVRTLELERERGKEEAAASAAELLALSKALEKSRALTGELQKQLDDVRSV